MAAPGGNDDAPPVISPATWKADVDRMGEKELAELAKWRGWDIGFCRQLKADHDVGLHRYKGKLRWAFANKDRDGEIVSIHCRVAGSDGEVDWRYDPAGRNGYAFVRGDLRRAQYAFLSESRWDTFSLEQKLEPAVRKNAAFIATPGASMAKTLTELELAHLELYALPQNDEAGGRWLKAVIEAIGRPVRVLHTPDPHKDFNDWFASGINPAEFNRAFQNAETVAPPTAAGTERKKKRKTKSAADEEELAEKLEAQAQKVAQSIDAYYDQQRKEYVLRIAPEVYQTRSEAQFKRDLRFRNLTEAFIERRNWSQIDLVLRWLQENRYVSYVGALAGKSCGFYHENGIRFLVTSQAHIIEPKPGEWPTLNSFISNLLAGDTEPYGEDQLEAFYGWLQVSVLAERQQLFQPGQALAIAGPIESGKSLMQSLITEILGGRSAKAALFLQGRTDYNGELFEAEHLMLEDEAASTLHKDRLALASSIKSIIANRIQPCHPKYRQIVNLPPWWRLTISLNDRSDRLLVLPPLTEDIADKINLLRASCHPMPMSAESPDQKAEFWQTLKSELPAFLHWLLNEYKIADSWRNVRFGVRAFHHPQLLTDLEELSPAYALLELIDQADIWQAQLSVWEGTALELRALLLSNQKTHRDAGRLLDWTNAAGQYLNDLAQMRPTRVKAFRTATRRWFEIYRDVPL
jgi:hypothetical protein